MDILDCAGVGGVVCQCLTFKTDLNSPRHIFWVFVVGLKDSRNRLSYRQQTDLGGQCGYLHAREFEQYDLK